jgi:maltodextrin utilization protein YvdJ
MNLNDWIGSVGVAILLIAFMLILANKISKNGMVYLSMNCVGSGLAAIASYLIHYTPFIILELAWMLASLFGIWKFYKDRNRKKLL